MFSDHLGSLDPTLGSKTKRPKSRLGTRRQKPMPGLGLMNPTKLFDMTPSRDVGVCSFPSKSLFDTTPSPNSGEESKELSESSLTLPQRNNDSALKDILNTPKIEGSKPFKSILSPVHNGPSASFNMQDSAVFATPPKDNSESMGNSTGDSDDSYITAVDSRVNIEPDKSLFKEIFKPSHFNKENNENETHPKPSGTLGDLELFKRVLPKESGKNVRFASSQSDPQSKSPLQQTKPSFFKSVQDGKTSRVMTFAEVASPFKKEQSLSESMQDTRSSLNTALSTDSMFDDSLFKKPEVFDGPERRKGSHFSQISRANSDDSGFSQASLSNSLKETFLIDDGHHQYRVEHMVEENKKLEYSAQKKDFREKFHLAELGNVLQNAGETAKSDRHLFKEREPGFSLSQIFESPKRVFTPQISTPRQDSFASSKEKPEKPSQSFLQQIPNFFSDTPHSSFRKSAPTPSVKVSLFQDKQSEDSSPSCKTESDTDSHSSEKTVVQIETESKKEKPFNPPQPVAQARFETFKKPLPVKKAPSADEIYVNGKSYKVLSLLGRGGSSEVYQVFDSQTSAVMAVKCVKLSGVDEKIAKEYINEVELLSKLQGCTSVIRMQASEFVPASKTLFVVMEKGDTDFSNLMKSLSGTQKMSMAMITYYWTEMLTCVKDIHDRGIIHSDLKPANFLLVCGRLKLIDFGIASSLQDDMTSVLKEVTTGTFNYMSPEAIRNSEDCRKGYKINYKSDVWSLGCILCNMIFGKTPFSHIGSTWAKLQAIADIHSEVVLPKGDRDIPLELRLSLHWCLRKDPKARPSVDQLLELVNQSSKIFEGEEKQIFDKLKYEHYGKLLPSHCHRQLERKVLNY